MNFMGSLLMLTGSVFILIAAIGMLRMPDLLIRMHSATKAGTLGVGLVLVGTALHFQKTSLSLEAAAAILFIYITAPIASHLIARAAYLSGIKLAPNTVIDELHGQYDLKKRRLLSPDEKQGSTDA